MARRTPTQDQANAARVSDRTIRRRSRKARALTDRTLAHTIDEQKRRDAQRDKVQKKLKRDQERARCNAIAVQAVALEPTTPPLPDPLPATRIDEHQDTGSRATWAARAKRYDAAIHSLYLVQSLPQTLRYLDAGGTVPALLNPYTINLHHNANTDEERMAQLVPSIACQTWLKKFPLHGLTVEHLRDTLTTIREHPSTVALALHPADQAHVGLHLHVISYAAHPALAILQDRVGAHPNAQPVHDIVALTDYLDHTTRTSHGGSRWAVGGVQFGRGAPQEFRRLASARILHSRITWRGLGHSKYQRGTNLRILCELMAEDFRQHGCIPERWKEYAVDLFADAAAFNCPLMNAELNQARVAWSMLPALCLKPRRASWKAGDDEVHDDVEVYDDVIEAQAPDDDEHNTEPNEDNEDNEPEYDEEYNHDHYDYEADNTLRADPRPAAPACIWREDHRDDSEVVLIQRQVKHSRSNFRTGELRCGAERWDGCLR